MKIGIDYYNCITQYPDRFRELARALMIGGMEVIILSAVGERQLKKHGDLEAYENEILSYEIPHTKLIIVHFDDDKAIPQLKHKAIIENGIEVMIDDRPETIAVLHAAGITALQVPKPLKKKPLS